MDGSFRLWKYGEHSRVSIQRWDSNVGKRDVCGNCQVCMQVPLKVLRLLMMIAFKEILGECLLAIVARVRDPSCVMSCLLDSTSCPKVVELLRWFLNI